MLSYLVCNIGLTHYYICCCVFFFKQKTAYEMRISDWSSDVCSSDLVALTDETSFAGDLEWDSLTVMDFVAEVEDSFDIIISMNQQAEIENVGDRKSVV